MITVVTPARNAARTIAKAIRSVRRQSYGDWEHVIVDDASSDGTPDIVRRLSLKDGRIRIVCNAAAQGPDGARLAGARAAQGSHVFFLDADDRLEPLALEQMERTRREQNADVVVTGIKMVFPGLPFSLPYGALKTGDKAEMSGVDAMEEMLRFENIMPVVIGKMYVTELLRRHLQPRSLTVGEDMLANVQTLPFASKVAFTPYTGYCWRYSGLGEKYYLQKWDEYLRGVRLTADELERVCAATALDLGTSLRGLGVNYARNLRESCIQRILKRHNTAEVEAFAAQGLREPLLQSLPEWEGISMEPRSAPAFMENCRRFLREHKKYYNFTRVLRFIYRR